MCARQHTFHSRGSLLPTREDTDGAPWIPLWNPRFPISVLELTKNEVGGGSRHWPRSVLKMPGSSPYSSSILTNVYEGASHFGAVKTPNCRQKTDGLGEIVALHENFATTRTVPLVKICTAALFASQLPEVSGSRSGVNGLNMEVSVKYAILESIRADGRTVNSGRSAGGRTAAPVEHCRAPTPQRSSS